MKVFFENNVFNIDVDQLDELPRSENWSLAVHEWFAKDGVKITTSGSTGKPKTIYLPKNLIEWSAKQTRDVLQLKNEKVHLCIPVTKIGGRMLLLRSIIYNWDVQIDQPSGNPMVGLNEDHACTLISIVPYQLTHILKDISSIKKLLRFKTVLIGGAELPIVVEKQLVELARSEETQFYMSYGMTETASHIALRKIGTTEPNHYTLFSGVLTDILDNGCLTVYIPEVDWKTETNDRVEVHKDQLHYMSRLDDVINSGGLKFSMGDVEKEIISLLVKEQIDCELIVWKMSDLTLGEKLVFVGLNNNVETRIVEIVTKYVTAYNRPKVYFWTDKFLRTESGKIDRDGTVKKLIEVRG